METVHRERVHMQTHFGVRELSIMKEDLWWQGNTRALRPPRHTATEGPYAAVDGRYSVVIGPTNTCCSAKLLAKV